MLKKLPLKSYLLYICIALFLTTGVTFSKYVVSSTGGDEARIAKFGELTLTEDAGQGFIYTPGVPITKDPKVSFSVNEVSAYVFVTVRASGWEYTVPDTYKIGEKYNWTVDSTRWTYLLHDEEQAVFYIHVPAGNVLEEVPIIKGDTILVADTTKNSEMGSIGEITFQAYAVQANGFESAAEAWSSISVK